MNKEFLELLKKRRSVRHFSEQKVESEKIEAILEAALTSPSSKNTRAWNFYIIQDKTIIEKLSQSKPMGGRFLKGAPLAIVITGDENITDMWVEDCSIASTIIQLAAEEQGLGSCWIQIRGRYNDEQQTIFAEQYIHELLNIEPNRRVLNIIALGYDLNERAHRDNNNDNKVIFI
ncbi:MAG: nitroreductase family protein [Rikenellaceae bacterium]